MPQLPNVSPGLGSLGDPSVPQSNRGIASYDADAVPKAETALGAEGMKAGEVMLDSQDKVDMAYAKSHLMVSAIKAQKDAELNPDPVTSEENFNASVKQATVEAAGMIKNSSLRKEMVASSADDVRRSYTAMMQNNIQKVKDNGKASLIELGDKNGDAFAMTSDPVLQKSLVQEYNNALDTQYNSGTLTAVERDQAKDKFRDNTSKTWFENQPLDSQAKLLRQSLPASITGAQSPGNYIAESAKENGVNPDDLSKAAILESGGNPSAVNGKSQGLFQFQPDTAKKYGLSNPLDASESSGAAARLWKDNSATLNSNLGRAPSADEVYLAHQQGAAGATALLKNPDVNAVDALTPLYKNKAAASAAITKNGGTADMTAGEFSDMWKDKFNNADTSPLGQAPDDSFKKTGTPLDLIHPDKQITAWRKLQSDFKYSDDQARSAISQGAQLLKDGIPLSDDQASAISSASAGAFNPKVRIMGDHIMRLNGYATDMQSMGPVQAQANLIDLQNLQKNGKMSPDQMDKLLYLEKAVPAMQEQVNKDPVGFFERSHGQQAVDLSDPKTLMDATSRAKFISNQYGVPMSKSFFNSQSANQLNEQFNNATANDQRKFVENMALGFGANAIDGTASFAKLNPNLSYAVSRLASNPVPSQDDVNVAMGVVAGDRKIKEDKDAAIPLSKVDDIMQDMKYDKILPPGSSSYEVGRQAARALYASRFNGNYKASTDDAKAAITSVMGDIVKINGKDTISPQGVPPDVFQKFINNINEKQVMDALVQATPYQPGNSYQVKMPVNDKVAFVPGRDKMRLVPFANGVYQMVDKNDKPYVNENKTFAILRFTPQDIMGTK